jgi:hypothetical protein
MKDKHKVFKTPQDRMQERAREHRRDASGLTDENEAIGTILLPPEPDEDDTPHTGLKYVPKKAKRVKFTE